MEGVLGSEAEENRVDLSAEEEEEEAAAKAASLGGEEEEPEATPVSLTPAQVRRVRVSLRHRPHRALPACAA